MKRSAGILLYRRRDGKLEVFIAHPGGPYNAKKDLGFWSLPKGLCEENEELFETARREFKEEIGQDIPDTGVPLGSVLRKDGKEIHAWAIEGDADPDKVVSNIVEVAWPPRTGKTMHVPEIDRAEWFTPEEARQKLQAAQAVFIDRLIGKLGYA